MSKGEEILEDRLYTETHEWIKKIDEKTWQIGITDYAQFQLKDIYAVDLPKEGEELKQFQAWGQIESEKGASELCIPISGKITKVNKDNLGEIYDTGEPNPKTTRYGGELFNINKKPYETWLIEIESTGDKSELDKLINHEAYKKLIK